MAQVHAAGGSKTREAITIFKERMDVAVLLLPITSAGNGLNLPEANHVILLEPSLNRANELQVKPYVCELQVRPYVWCSTREYRLNLLDVSARVPIRR